MQLKKGSCNFFTCVNSKAGSSGINLGTLGNAGIAGTTSYKGIQYVDVF